MKANAPDLYSPEWWQERSIVLRRIAPRHPGWKALESLDAATFGDNPTEEMRRQSEQCYRDTWPESPLSAPEWV